MATHETVDVHLLQEERILWGYGFYQFEGLPHPKEIKSALKLEKEIMKIKQGKNLMKVDRKGDRTGWHKMTKDNTATMEWKQSICQTVFIIRNGPDKGWYAT